MSTYDQLDRQGRLLADLRALADGPGHTATIISAAADELEIEIRRADDNGKSCSEFCRALETIREVTKEPSVREIAQVALRMPWLTGNCQSCLADLALHMLNRTSQFAELANKIEVHLKLDETPGYFLSPTDQEMIVEALRFKARSSVSFFANQQPEK